MTAPHKDCISRLQDLIGCACIGDCLTEGRGTLLEKKDKKGGKNARHNIMQSRAYQDYLSVVLP